MRDPEACSGIRAMQKGDEVLFYQVSQTDPGIAGVAEVVIGPYPDPTSDDGLWFSVDIAPRVQFIRFLPLAVLAAEIGLQDMLLFQYGERLSVQPVAKQEFEIIRKSSRPMIGSVPTICLLGLKLWLMAAWPFDGVDG